MFPDGYIIIDPTLALQGATLTTICLSTSFMCIMSCSKAASSVVSGIMRQWYHATSDGPKTRPTHDHLPCTAHWLLSCKHYLWDGLGYLPSLVRLPQRSEANIWSCICNMPSQQQKRLQSGCRCSIHHWQHCQSTRVQTLVNYNWTSNPFCIAILLGCNGREDVQSSRASAVHMHALTTVCLSSLVLAQSMLHHAAKVCHHPHLPSMQ